MKDKNSFLGKIYRFSKLQCLKILRVNSSPEKVALGIASGVFGGCFPMIPGLPLQSVIAIVAAFITKSSKVAAVIATWVSNPLNWLLFYYVQFQIAKHILPFNVEFSPDKWAVTDFMEIGWQGVVMLMVGGFVIAIPSSIISYFVSLKLIKRHRRKKNLKRLRKDRV